MNFSAMELQFKNIYCVGRRTKRMIEKLDIERLSHEGRGIGDRFLGHVERCAVLLHLVDGTSEDVVGDYNTIIHEVEQYGEGLADKPRITVLNKIDALDEDELADEVYITVIHEVAHAAGIDDDDVAGLGCIDCLVQHQIVAGTAQNGEGRPGQNTVAMHGAQCIAARVHAGHAVAYIGDGDRFELLDQVR